jgi:cytochrome c553
MSGKRTDIWFAGSIGITVAVAVTAFAIGFVWLPLADTTAGVHGAWNAICAAAGLVQRAPDLQPIQTATYPVTQVEVSPQMLREANADSVGSGATLALRCTMCHGPRGVSQAQAPNLAGQYAVAIYKELADFKTGARPSAVMEPLAADLSDSDMRDLAAYYAYLPRPSGPDVSVLPAIVAGGAPMRGIAPCGACHGTVGTKAGATWLGGQPAGYLHAQLVGFATDTRRNDIDAVMRNIARRMTPDEIEAASRFYEEHP